MIGGIIKLFSGLALGIFYGIAKIFNISKSTIESVSSEIYKDYRREKELRKIKAQSRRQMKYNDEI